MILRSPISVKIRNSNFDNSYDGIDFDEIIPTLPEHVVLVLHREC